MVTGDLVVVACHAVFTADGYVGGYPGEGPLYLQHAEAGVALAAERDALLLFSGGATQAAAGPRTEALSYWERGRDARWWGHPELEARAFTEDYARDSFENLLFPLFRFQRIIGRWPEHVTAAGWRFKAPRFDLHRGAIRWPAERFTYWGVNDPPPEALAKAEAGEAATVRAVEADPWLQGAGFTAKRAQRDPFRRGHPYPPTGVFPWHKI